MLRRLLADNVLLALQYAAGVLVPLALIPHFVKTLGAAEYGRIAIAVAALSYASIVVQYAFHLTGPADLAARSTAVGRKALFLDIALARIVLLAGILAVAASSLLIAPLAATTSEGSRTLHWWLLLALPVGAAFNAGWYLQCTGRLAALSAISIAAAALTLLVGFIFVRGSDPDATLWAAGALGLGPLVTGLGTFVWAATTLPRERATTSWQRAIRTLSSGREIFLSQFVAAGYTLAGPIVVGVVVGERSAGLYSAVERIANALQTALGLTHVAAYPRLAALYRKARTDYLRLVQMVLGVNTLAVGALGVLLWLMVDAVSAFVFGEVSTESRWLLALAWLWLAVSVVGPPITGYLTISGSRSEILSLTWRVLLVSLPAGTVGAVVFASPGWLAGLIAGQCLVLGRAIGAYARERSTLTTHH
jgi:O-antigen/teichoic acid export membrane protein